MLPLLLFLFLIFPAALLAATQSAGDLQSITFPSGGVAFNPGDPCMVVSPPCLSDADRFSLEALRSIHQMMDDDKDGGIEVEESVEFIIEDMKQQQTNKHSNLHREDQHITVEELWKGWKSSEVHNWTQDDVLRWLREFVELPQYERNFKDLKVNGNTLPRIAANEPSFLSSHLRVQDQRDKQKLNIKALDVVLFGPPTRPPHNYMKDLLLIVSVVMGVGGCWFAQAQNKASKIHITKMMKDLESLQRAEQSLLDLQEQLERAQEEKRNVAEEKQNLEEKMRDEIMGAQEEAHRLQELRQGAVSELSRLRYAEEELVQVRGALKQAEKDMQASWTASDALQQWLQLTHEVEVQYYNVKKHSAELQLATAKEEAERIKKKRSSVLGTLHVAHSSSLDQVDHKILEAKNALSEVTACLRERLHRWQQIERICGFPVIRNPGLTNLTAQLYSDSLTLGLPRLPQSSCLCHSSVHGSIEDLLEESPAPILSQIPGAPLKRSPRTRASTIRRTRRHGITQPPTPMISADPDLLIQIRAPYPCFDEDDRLFRKTIKKQDSQERFSDSDYTTSPPHSKTCPCPSAEVSSHRLYHDETEPLADSSVAAMPLNKEVEAGVESPNRKIYTEGLESLERKIVKEVLDSSMENSLLMMSKDESVMEAPPRKTSRDRSEVPEDFGIRNVSSTEFDSEYPSRKVDREPIEEVLDNPSRCVPRDRGDLPLDVRKILWDEVEASDFRRKKLSKGMMGASIDSASRKTVLEGSEFPFDLLSRRIARDSLGMSLDGGVRKLDSSLWGIAKDKMAEVTHSRKSSQDALDCCADTASMKILPREEPEQFMAHTSSAELGSEPSISKRICKDEREVPPRKRTTQMSRDDEVTQDTPTGRLSRDRVESPMETQWQRVVKGESEESDSNSVPGETQQPDLTVTSHVPLKSSVDIFPVGPLSQLVYDGILEKSCNAIAATPMSLSASTPNLPQCFPRLLAESESPLAPARVTFQSPPSTSSEAKDDRNRDKEKSRKSLKLKNLFKKKNEAITEKIQSGLQKL
ncbi:stromal interaction molecule 2 [Dunckerocampus dactyliophorus]|uniref:stromal interaction molecule 2 n=1 Tax=Dunckerocampus dactyliophorus TaxID=161453 RepID=UPI00240725FB|nr:stromal interaction molecule 2 [Dunckerocampus dactyliophorus]